MTYEELIAGMDKWEAVFRSRIKTHFVHNEDGKYEIHLGTCLECLHWSKDNGGHCTEPTIEEKCCRAEFEEWKKTEAE
jgi:hypothetical protein